MHPSAHTWEMAEDSRESKTDPRPCHLLLVRAEQWEQKPQKPTTLGEQDGEKGTHL